MNYKPIVFGAVSGFVGVFLADLNNWRLAPDGEAFNWKKAMVHWATGAISGAMTGAGLSAAS